MAKDVFVSVTNRTHATHMSKENQHKKRSRHMRVLAHKLISLSRYLKNPLKKRCVISTNFMCVEITESGRCTCHRYLCCRSLLRLMKKTIKHKIEFRPHSKKLFSGKQRSFPMGIEIRFARHVLTFGHVFIWGLGSIALGKYWKIILL